MPNISPKQRLVEAAQAVLLLSAIRRIQGALDAEDQAVMEELRDALEAARPQPTEDLGPMDDPEYFRALAARGGRAGRGAQKQRDNAVDAGRLGGRGGLGVKKPRRITTRTSRCRRCNTLVRFSDPQVGRVFGEISGRAASWYKCPGCYQPVDPYVWEDEREA